MQLIIPSRVNSNQRIKEFTNFAQIGEGFWVARNNRGLLILIGILVAHRITTLVHIMIRCYVRKGIRMTTGAGLTRIRCHLKPRRAEKN